MRRGDSTLEVTPSCTLALVDDLRDRGFAMPLEWSSNVILRRSASLLSFATILLQSQRHNGSPASSIRQTWPFQMPQLDDHVESSAWVRADPANE